MCLIGDIALNASDPWVPRHLDQLIFIEFGNKERLTADGGSRIRARPLEHLSNRPGYTIDRSAILLVRYFDRDQNANDL